MGEKFLGEVNRPVRPGYRGGGMLIYIKFTPSTTYGINSTIHPHPFILSI